MATVKFPSEMPSAADVGGNDKLMISKDGSGEAFQVSFSNVKQYLEITDIELDPVQGGATEAEATVIPNGPSGQKRKMDASPGWYSVGGVPVEATSGHVWKWFWNGSSWSLVDMGELPDSSAKAVDWQAGTYYADQTAVKDGVLYRVKPSVSSTTGEPGVSEDWEAIGKNVDVADDFGESTSEAATQRLVTTLRDKIAEVEGDIPEISDLLEKGGYEGSAKDLDDKIPEVSNEYGNSTTTAAAQRLVTELKGTVDNISENYISRGEKGNINGVAPLNTHGQVPSEHINIDRNVWGLDRVNNTSDIEKPLSIADIAEHLKKEDKANKSTTLINPNHITYPTTLAVHEAISQMGDISLNVATPSGTPEPGDGIWLATDIGIYTNYGGFALTEGEFALVSRRNGLWTHSIGSVGVGDATMESKGKIALAGDLSGTAEEPKVPSVDLKEGYGIFERLQDSRKRMIRILYGGTSIANIERAGGRRFIQYLQSKYGNAGGTMSGHALGGSYTNDYRGWKKQATGTWKGGRVYSVDTSEPIILERFFRRAVVRYSKETDGGEFDIYINGDFITTLDSYGESQQRGCVWYIDVPLQVSVFEVRPKIANKAYIEAFEFIEDPSKGILFMDTSFGGSSLATYRDGFTGNVGWNSIDSVFLNPDPNAKADIMILTYCVNDAGSGNSVFYSYFETAIRRIAQGCFEQDIPLVLVVEMGGHYSIYNGNAGRQSNYEKFQIIRNIFRSLGNEYANISVVDWHERSGLQTRDLSKLQLLLNRYYKGTSNVETGELSGDMIHPSLEGHKLWHEMMCKISGIEYIGEYIGEETTSNYTDNRVAEDSRFPLKSAMGHRAWLNAGEVSLKKRDARGVMREFKLVGKAFGPLGTVMPLWQCDDLSSMSNHNTNIDLLPTSDEFGKYIDYNNSHFEILPFTAEDVISATSVTIVGTGIKFSAYSTPDVKAKVIIDGNEFELPWLEGVNTEYPVSPSVSEGDNRPYAVSIVFSSSNKKATGPYVAGRLTGRVYGVYVTETDFPCIAGRNKDLPMQLRPTMYLESSPTLDQIVPGQRFMTKTDDGYIIRRVCNFGARCLNSGQTTGYFPAYELERGEWIYYPLLDSIPETEFIDRLGGDVITETNFQTLDFTEEMLTELMGKDLTLSTSVCQFGPAMEIQLQRPGSSASYALNASGVFEQNTTNRIPIPKHHERMGWHDAVFVKFQLPDDLDLGQSWRLRVKNNPTGGSTRNSLWVLTEGNDFLI